MFIAQVDEVDAYDSEGHRVNDINTLAQYISDVLLNHKNKSRPDEDDDNARYFHIVKLNGHSFNKQVIESEQKDYSIIQKLTFPHYNTRIPISIVFDVVTPPPRLLPC